MSMKPAANSHGRVGSLNSASRVKRRWPARPAGAGSNRREGGRRRMKVRAAIRPRPATMPTAQRQEWVASARTPVRSRPTMPPMALPPI